ncbi:CAP domain-containing protein [Psychrobacillus sp. OK032]|uniref:CAP domain-containing protein n=1 Tax=Psychrobacillus sp. OK032 TaxID=1884358 RepID=UPI0008C26D35|nr:CAP domain-containing protein [Psychrobacillus sp. OK032]SES09731.1 uncharacterized protein, YkwD family [Psychrobacillus sp. OK032]
MNKKHSIIVGLLAGGLLLSTNTAEAAMPTGNSHTTSKANTSVTYKWQSQYNYNLTNVEIQNLVNKELKTLKPIIIKKATVVKKPVVIKKAPVIKKPATPVTPPVAQKPVTPITPPVVKEPVKENNGSVQVPAAIQQVVDLTNQERAKAGLKALQIDTKLTQSAQAKSQDMKNKNYFSHTSPTYGSPFEQMKSFGVSYKSAAENIAKGQRSATEVVKAWMASPGHKKNIMNPSYTHIGVGLSDSGYYWTQQFIGK